MVDAIKSEFPFFAVNPNLVYLDSAATALKPQRVIDALALYNAHESVNVHRGVYRLSQRATDTVESVRKKTAAFLSHENAATAIFTRGTTDGINLLATVLTHPDSRLTDFFPAFADKKPPAILLSQSEHHANIVPWQIAAHERGYKLLYIPVDSDGKFAAPDNFLEEIATAYSLRIISLGLESNVTGIIHDLIPYREWAAKHGAVFIVDAAQAVVHVPDRVRGLKPDFSVFSAHKLFGATGVGAVVGAKNVLDACTVYQGGGGMINTVHEDASTYLEAPTKFEAGTQAIGEIYALGKALDFAAEYAQALRTHEADLRAYADERLKKTGARIFGLSATERSPIYSFEIQGVHAHDTGTLLDEQDICVRAGHHCCQLLMRVLGVSATARASFSIYNTRDDVDRLTQGIEYVKKIFRK